MEESPSIEDRLPKAPRWLQVAAGLLFVPAALLCLAGSVAMVVSPAPKAPFLSAALGAAFILVSMWVLSLAARLILARPSKGLLGPLALRFSAALFLLLPIAGLFTGYYQEHGLIALGQAVMYLFVASVLWSLAKHRGRAA